MSQTIPTTINNRQKINNPPPETAADYLLTHNAITKETGSISKTNLFKPLQKQIDEINNPDGFLKIGSVNQAGNTVSIPALEFEWKIKPVLFFTNEAFSTVIAPATDGYNRIDAIVANDFGGFTKIQGNESLTAAIQPNRPNNSLPVTFITVFGANIVAIAPPTEPVLTLQKATNTQLGVVKLANPGTSADPVVYSKEDIDELLSGMGDGSIITTVKPILSTALATQNIAGFVTYVNALNPVLAVADNEIVKFNTTDTGRVFELKLRGRSFGTGQAAIVAADILEVTEFLNKDIKLSNYPSSRNDGQLPTNRVFSPDANGNFKLYTIATAPAPYLGDLIPDSCLPSTTGNFRIIGDFFTPDMCNRTLYPNAIIIQGQSINYANFISSQELLVNVTTGAAEGLFDITLDNGISKTFSKVLLIVLGTVYKPEDTDWNTISQPINFESGSALTKTAASVGSAKLNFTLDKTKKFSVYLSIARSPLVTGISYTSLNVFEIIDSVTGDIHGLRMDYYDYQVAIRYVKNGVIVNSNLAYQYLPGDYMAGLDFRFHWDLTQMYIYRQSTLVHTFAPSEMPNAITSKFIIGFHDLINIKYVEHF